MLRDRQGIERRARALFEHSRAAMLIADDERRYVDCNPAACELLGLGQDEIVGRRVDDLAPPELRGHIEARWREFLDAGIQAGEWELVAADGEAIAIEYSATANVMPGRHLCMFLPACRRNGAREVVAELNGAPQKARLRITPREREVLALVARGMTSEEVARELGVSTETVRTHVSNALERLGARTRAHAISLALREGALEV